MAEDLYKASLAYHKMGGRPGKLEVVPTKPCRTARDLSLAYSPGVAEPCLHIAREPDDVFEYTNKGNLVAVISNGTAVLGLGDIGPAASKPVMEGKAVLFKRFAGIDVFDIEVNEKDPVKFVDAIEKLAPTFGGINLEDIKGPECFYIEQELEHRIDIPVFHDDQHGTAIIASAGLLNACEIIGKKMSDLKVVFNGAGAAGISVAKLICELGVKRDNIIMCDKGGVIYQGREETMDPYKAEFATDTEARTLAEAMVGADCFMGLSVGNCVTPEMLKSMANDPIVFAMANPTPEIDYPTAIATRPDVIMATGRSDYPNQVNNVLGFPFIFRGALDTRATHINMEMKLAAVKALAELAHEQVPMSVSRAYGGEHFEFGRNYIIPKPFDPRVLYYESVAVAEAAIKSGVARIKLDIEAYREQLRQRVDAGRSLVAVPLSIAQDKNMRIAIPEGELPKLASVARQTVAQRLGHPVLVGNPEAIRQAMNGVDPEKFSVVDPTDQANFKQFAAMVRAKRPFDELSDDKLKKDLANPFVHAVLLVECGQCDGLVAASDRPYAEMVRPVLQYGSVRDGVTRVAGLHMMQLKDGALFFADTTLIQDPSAEELAEIAMRASRAVMRLGITPRVAFVSYANLSTTGDPEISKLRRAWHLVRRREPELECFPDVQVDVALNPEQYRGAIGTKLPANPANILIFPNLHAANAAYRLAKAIGGGAAIGPMLLGLRRPCNVLPRGSTEDEIIDMMAVTAYNAQRRKAEIESGRHTMVRKGMK